MNTIIAIGAGIAVLTGIGAGIGMGGAFSSMTNGMFNNSSGFSQGSNVDNPLDRINQNNTQHTNTTQQQSDETSQSDPVETLKKLKQMLELDLITQEVYNEKLTEIMSKMQVVDYEKHYI